MENNKCYAEMWTYDDTFGGWVDNKAGVCSALKKPDIADMKRSGKCGTRACPFYKPAKAGMPDAIIRYDYSNGTTKFGPRR